eukprot:1122109-Rhodomonas_salina.1
MRRKKREREIDGGGCPGDAEILVRDGELVRTRNFLDAQTEKVLVLAFFHAPGSGVSTALQIHGSLDGNSIHMHVKFRHLSFVPEERRGHLVSSQAARARTQHA